MATGQLLKKASNDLAAELLQRHFAQLIEAITPSVGEIATKLYAKKIVTNNVLVMGNKEIPRERAERLVNEMHSAVKKNGDTLFQIADVLEQHTPANHLAPVLRSEFNALLDKRGKSKDVATQVNLELEEGFQLRYFVIPLVVVLLAISIGIVAKSFADLLQEVHDLRHHKKMYFQPEEFTIDNFFKRMTSIDNWKGPTFYTSPDGYNVYVSMYCTEIIPKQRYPHGKICIEMTLGVFLLPGDYDDQLKWPFQANFTFLLLSQMESVKNYSLPVHNPFVNRATSEPVSIWTKKLVFYMRGDSTIHNVLNRYLVDGTTSIQGYLHNRCETKNNDCVTFRIT